MDAIEGDIIELRDGQYVGSHMLDQNFVTVRGNVPTDESNTSIYGVEGVPVFTIPGNFSRVENLTLNTNKSTYGVVMECEIGCELRGCKILDVSKADTVDHNKPTGIHVESPSGSVDRVKIYGNEIIGITGGSSDHGRDGGVFGISLNQVSHSFVMNNSIRTLNAGQVAIDSRREGAASVGMKLVKPFF